MADLLKKSISIDVSFDSKFLFIIIIIIIIIILEVADLIKKVDIIRLDGA